LIGQANAREQLQRIIQSGRASHAYLFTGPAGVGKTAFALAFAEVLNGIDNLTDLQEKAFSKKSSWFNHPDIHLFIPLPTTVTKSQQNIIEEMKNRLSLLAKDPYDIVDFKFRPVLMMTLQPKTDRLFIRLIITMQKCARKLILNRMKGAIQ